MRSVYRAIKMAVALLGFVYMVACGGSTTEVEDSGTTTFNPACTCENACVDIGKPCASGDGATGICNLFTNGEGEYRGCVY